MAQESSVIIGSGLNPAKYATPFNARSNERHLRGTDVCVINPEDNSAGLVGSGSQRTTTSNVPTLLPLTPLPYRRAIAIYNASAAPLYIGFNSNVSASNGFPLASGQTLPLQVNGAIKVWGISASPVDVRIIELA